MLDKITINGEYLGNDPRGIMVGGYTMIPNSIVTLNVNEDTFENLKSAEKSGWFKIHNDNFVDFARSRGRVIVETQVEEAPVEEAPVEEAPVEEAPVEEAPVEEAPVEEAPVEEAPVEEAPVEEAPLKKSRRK